MEHTNESDRPFVVCPRCAGHGFHANPVFDGMTTSELYDDLGYEEADEFLAEYTTRGGAYDVRCEECNGARVVVAECPCDSCENDRLELADMYAMERAEREFGC